MATCCWQEAVSTSLLSSTCAEGCYFRCRGNRPTMGLASDLQLDTIPRCGCCCWRYSHYSLESHSWGSVQFVENPLWYVNTQTQHCDSTSILKPRTVTCYCRPAHSCAGTSLCSFGVFTPFTLTDPRVVLLTFLACCIDC